MFGRNLNPFNRTEKLCQLMSGEGVQVIVGNCACTDGKTVELPAIPIGADDIAVLIHEHSITHEPAHITEGTFTIKEVAPTPLSHSIFNCVEDVRVENAQEHGRYPGLKVFRAEFYRDFNRIARRLGTAQSLEATDLRTAIKGALCLLIIRARGKQLGVTPKVKTSAKVEEIYQRVMSDVIDDVSRAVKPKQALDLAGIIHERLRNMLQEDAEKKQQEAAKQEKAKKPQPNGESDNEGEESDGGADKDEPEDKDGKGGDSDKAKPEDKNAEDKDGKGGDSDEAEEPEDKDGKDGGDSGDEAEPEDKDGDAKGKGSKGEPDDDDKDSEGGSGEGDDEEPLTKEQQAAADDEADKAMQEIEQDVSKTISEQALDEINDKSVATQEDFKPTPTAEVSEMDVSDVEYIPKLATDGVTLLGSDGAKMTRHLIANSRPRTVRNRDYGRLDIRAVASDEMDVRKDLYNQRKPGALCPAAVSILIDGSGSMGNDGAAKRRYSTLVAHGVAHYLDRARVPFEVAYFDSTTSFVNGKTTPNYMVVKAWADPWHGKAITRAREFNRGGTPLASTMTMQAQRLLERPEDKKVAIVLTDGEPCGTGEHISRSVAVVKALREMGVVVIGIGINVDVSQIFGDDAVCLPPQNIGAEMVRRLTEILDSHRNERSATVNRRQGGSLHYILTKRGIRWTPRLSPRSSPN